MATQPLQPLTGDWSLLVTAGDEFTLTLRDGSPVRIAAQDAAPAPIPMASPSWTISSCPGLN